MSGPAGSLWVLKPTDDRRPGCNTLTRGSRREVDSTSCNVALSTAHRWVVRWRAATLGERASLACLLDRSSRPHHRPRQVESVIEQRIVELRLQTDWGRGCLPAHSASPIGRSRKCFAATAARGRRDRPARLRIDNEWPSRATCCTWTAPGMRVERPGHARTGDRSQAERNWMRPDTRRLRLRPRTDRRPLTPGVRRAALRRARRDRRVERGLAFFESHGIATKRLMTDNAWVYARKLLEA
jgi:hypothetical protein